MRIVLILPFLALPAAAQEAEPPSLMERGLRLFMDGLAEEMAPMIDDLETLGEEALPLLEELRESLGESLADLEAYHAPEILPNGDILIRRKAPLDPELPSPNPDGSFDL